MARQTAQPTSNIYTILAFIALAALIGAIVYVWIRLSTLGIDPFDSTPSQAMVHLPRALGLA